MGAIGGLDLEGGVGWGEAGTDNGDLVGIVGITRGREVIVVGGVGDGGEGGIRGEEDGLVRRFHGEKGECAVREWREE